MAAKDVTTVEQKEVSHQCDSAKAAALQATKEPFVAHKHLRRIYSERGEKVNHKLERLQLSWKYEFSVSRLKNGHHQDLKYWLHKTGRALDTDCHRCGMAKETVEHAMGECVQIYHPATKLPEPYLTVTSPLKALE